MFESCFFFFFENRAVYEIISKKSGTAGQAIDKNIIWRKRYSCWITKAADKHALRICNKYCFSTTMIARTRLNMSLYLHCLSFVNIVPQHSSCRGNFISHETCIRFQLGILHPLQFTLLHFTENFQSAVLELLSGSGTRRKCFQTQYGTLLFKYWRFIFGKFLILARKIRVESLIFSLLLLRP